MTPLPPVIPVEAQAQDALALVLQAAGHPLLGDMALYEGTVAQGANPGGTSGTPTSLQDRSLVTGAGDQSWRRAWLLFLDGANAGQERFLQQVDGATGTLRWQPALDAAPAFGARFVLFRDYRWAQWLRWLNETARNIHYPLDVYVTPVTDALRYPVPAPIKRAGWLMDILVGPTSVAYTAPEARTVRWYHVNPTNVAGDLYAVLSRPLSQSQQLLFRARPPFAYETATPYTDLHSVLWAGGQDPALDPALVPPVRLFVLGTAWRSLQQKLTNLTGQPRELWKDNLERCARQYAQACTEWGVREVGRQLGYDDDWYPNGTLSWGQA